VIHVETHVGLGDPFTNAETTLRKERYGVVGIPHVRIDGEIGVIGASQSCPALGEQYQSAIDARLEEWEGTSPIEITGNLEIAGGVATVTASVELIDPGYSFDAHQVTLFLYEDHAYWCCGPGGVDRWDEVVRMVRSTSAPLTEHGARQIVMESVSASGLDPDRLRAVAIYEEIGGELEVIQASDFTRFESAFPPVASVPQGSGDALVPGTLSNVTSHDDEIDLDLDDSFGWPAEFRVGDDPEWHTELTLPLLAGQQVPCWVRVRTDSTRRAGEGALVAHSPITGQTDAIAMKVFNRAPSVLLVDDDRGFNYDQRFTEALASRGYFSDRVQVEVDANGPPLSALQGYDVVIWQTGHTASTLNLPDLERLRAYLDQGGGLFLQSMEYLSSHGPDPFTRDYLGIASYRSQEGAESAFGIAGDPITGGMAFPQLQWPNPNHNRVDVVEPTAAARSILRKETDESIALRLERPDGARVVFNSVLVSAFAEDAPDPGNLASLVVKTVEWIADVPSPSSAPALAFTSNEGLRRAIPNPFVPGVALEFALSERSAGRAVSLEVADASGRRVRRLFRDRLAAGVHELSWDGFDDEGRAAPTGVYFAILRCAGGESVLKLTRLDRE
jgi:hypothetical protein